MIQKNKIRMAFIVMIISFSFAFSSCSKDESVAPQTPGTSTPGTATGNAVKIEGSSFSPASITIKAGQTITWTNNDNMAHTVTSNPALFDSGNMAVGATFSYNFPTAGTYDYYCAYHAGMTGKVIVQ